jgi:uncharacterized membrane protein
LPDTAIDIAIDEVMVGRFVTKLLPVMLEDIVVVGLVTAGPGAITTGPVVVAEAVNDEVPVVGMLVAVAGADGAASTG